MTDEKQCSHCKEMKPLDGFYKHKSRPDGLSGYCKQCQIQATIVWQRENPDKMRVYKRRYHQKHPDRNLKSVNKWRANNPEKWQAMAQKAQEKYKAKQQEKKDNV